jgi:glucuronokinase
LEIKPSKADMPIFDSLESLREVTAWRGYYGGIRIIQAIIVRFAQYCSTNGIDLADRNFTVEYESNIPQRLGMGGSSAIITATLRALMQFFQVDIPKNIQANLALEAETKELGVSAGLQDRVIQVHEGLVYMDFNRGLMTTRGYGEYEELDPDLLPPLYLAYRTSLGEGSEVVHNDLRFRYESGDPDIHNAVFQWAAYAEEGRTALLARDYDRLATLMDANFNLRSRVMKISAGNREMIETARSLGVPSKFAGSGGAVVGILTDQSVFQRLEEAFRKIGVAIIRPIVKPLQRNALVSLNT